jgi:hypothetical protein
MFWAPVLLALATLAVGCGSATGPSDVALAEEFTLAPAEWVRIRGEGLTVAFDSVLSDSRCPTNARCVWEGDAVVALTLSQPGRPRATVELHTSARFARTAVYGDFEVALTGLEPQPPDGNPIPQTAYRATLRVTRPG